MMPLTAPQLRTLQAEHGPDFYLLDLDRLLQNYHYLLEAGQRIYSDFQIAYSVKTNYTPAVCQALSGAGALLEVVSEMEYELVGQLAHPFNKVVVNGPVHRFEFLENAFLNGSIVNLDSTYQLDFLEHIANKHPGKILEAGLRLNFQAGQPSRFGFEASEETLQPLLARIRQLTNVRLVSLHSHYCEGARSVEAYRERGRQMAELFARFFHDFPIRVLNAGGGFYSAMPPELAAQFSEPVPAPAACIEALCGPLAAAFPEGSRPTLLIEPGNALVADVMQFYCRVLEHKRLHGEDQLLLNGSIYDVKPTRNRKNLPLSIISMEEQSAEQVHNAALTGHTCMEEDVLYRGYSGQVAAGDYAVFSNVGAYTNVLRPPFITPAPPIIARQQGQLRLARRRETAAGIFSSYVF